jgi:hypothetical protein
MCIGFDRLPASVRSSTVFTGNNLGQLAGLHEIPSENDISALKNNDPRIRQILAGENALENLHRYAKEILDKNDDEQRALAGRIAWLGTLLT